MLHTTFADSPHTSTPSCLLGSALPRNHFDVPQMAKEATSHPQSSINLKSTFSHKKMNRKAKSTAKHLPLFK